MIKEDWRSLDPRLRRAIKAGLWIVIPTLLFAMVDPSGTLVQVWFVALFLYVLFRFLRWALHADRVDRDRRKLDQSLWDDLKDIEGMVRESVAKPARKLFGSTKPKAFNSQGEPMVCILCTNFTNRGGRYCDDHA